MTRPLSRFYGQLVWLAASALFVAVLISAVSPNAPAGSLAPSGNIR